MTMTTYRYGNPDKKREYASISVSCVPVYAESGARLEPELGINSGSSGEGIRSGPRILEDGWDDWIFLSGCETSFAGSDLEIYGLPRNYAVNLYLNGELVAELTLLPEGGEWLG